MHRLDRIGQVVILEEVGEALTSDEPQEDAASTSGLGVVGVRITEHRAQHRQPAVLVDVEPAGPVAVTTQGDVGGPRVAAAVESRSDVLQPEPGVALQPAQLLEELHGRVESEEGVGRLAFRAVLLRLVDVGHVRVEVEGRVVVRDLRVAIANLSASW